MGCYADHYAPRIATETLKKLRPELDSLRAEFGAANKRQTLRLDQIETKLDRLLAIFEPQTLAIKGSIKKGKAP